MCALLPAVEEVITKKCSNLERAPPIREGIAVLSFWGIFLSAELDRNRFDPTKTRSSHKKLKTARNINSKKRRITEEKD